MCLRRWLLPLAACISFVPAAFTQTSDWLILNQLVPGQKVKVQTTQGKIHVGKVQSVTPDAIRVGKDQQIPKEDVQQILVWSAGHHGRNALIGLGIGAAAGVALGAGSCGGNDPIVSRGQCIAVGVPFFGGIGAGIGALLPSRGAWREVYRSKAPAQGSNGQ